MPASKTRQSKSKQSKSKPTKVVKSVNQHDTPRNVALGGLVGLILAYLVITRALNTGSYWEYFFGIVLLIIAIRLFIRSLRLNR